MFRRLFVFACLLLMSAPLMAQIDSLIVKTDSSDVRHQVMIRTTKGDIVVELYNGTPHHRDNFLKLVKSGYYDGILWHRVIADFMIQTGDSTTRHAKAGELLGEHDVNYTVPAEIRFPQFFHKWGALAAAREGDDVNPEKASSGAQFYIAVGRPFSPAQMDWYQAKMDTASNFTMQYTPEIRDIYQKYGGIPHLDGKYTVFGEVVKGYNVVREIDYVDTDANDRPLVDERIIKAFIIK